MQCQVRFDSLYVLVSLSWYTAINDYTHIMYVIGTNTSDKLSMMGGGEYRHLALIRQDFSFCHIV